MTTDDPHADTPAPDARRYPSTFGGLCYLGVLATTLIGVLWVILGDWRIGVRVIGGGLVAAGLLRLVLRQRSAGMLSVRHRFIDAALLVAAGAGVMFLSGSIPEQPL